MDRRYAVFLGEILAVTPPNNWDHTLNIINRFIWPETSKIPDPPQLTPSKPSSNTPPGFSTEGWAALKDNELESWIGDQLDRGPMPVFELTVPERVPRLLSSPSPERMQVMERRPESGIMELKLRTPEGSPFTAPTVPFLQGLLRIAGNEDDRTYLYSEFPEAATVISEIHSRLSSQDLPVIGPGGRVTVYQEPGGAQVDFVVRHRERPIPAIWRQRSEVAELVRRRIAEYDDVAIHCNFGYYELSKYTRQVYLRPAFLFLLDVSVSLEPDSNVTWREQVVVAASNSEGLSATEGLGGAS